MRSPITVTHIDALPQNRPMQVDEICVREGLSGYAVNAMLVDTDHLNGTGSSCPLRISIYCNTSLEAAAHVQQLLDYCKESRK